MGCLQLYMHRICLDCLSSHEHKLELDMSFAGFGRQCQSNNVTLQVHSLFQKSELTDCILEIFCLAEAGFRLLLTLSFKCSLLFILLPSPGWAFKTSRLQVVGIYI